VEAPVLVAEGLALALALAEAEWERAAQAQEGLALAGVAQVLAGAQESAVALAPERERVVSVQVARALV
jgi:hypothetical protein